MSSVRSRLPSSANNFKPTLVEDSAISQRPTTLPGVQTPSTLPQANIIHPSTQSASMNTSIDSWLLPPASEGAILDALFAKIVHSGAASSRLLSFLSHVLFTGVVSQRAVVSTCLACVETTPGISDHVMQSFAHLLFGIIPYYTFTFSAGDLTPEIKDFLSAFVMVVKCTTKHPCLASDLTAALSQDRVVTLVRACARRIPSIWPQLRLALSQLEDAPNSVTQMGAEGLLTHSAVSMSPNLKTLVARLSQGLSVGITPLDTIAASIGTVSVPPAEAPLSVALQTVFAITMHVFGNDVSSALRELWNHRETMAGDLPLLIALEKAAKPPPNASSSGSHSAAKYAFRNNVQACEAVVHFVAERSFVTGAAEKWSSLWGGKDRLKRIIVNAMPQVKSEIRSEAGALMVAMAVTCCAVMCLGPALRMRDTNDGVEPRDASAAELLQEQCEEVEDTVGELTSFAVCILEEAANAEEVPLWRSFGLWLLLLMSRAGCMLRACGCEHVRAVRVLRAWGGMPTGTPGTHTTHGGGAHKHSSQAGAGGHPQSSSLAASQTEGVVMFAGSASLAIIDVSDASGSDDTLLSLCIDLVQ